MPRNANLRRARSVQTLLLEGGLVPALFLVWATKLLQLNKSVGFHRRNVAMCAVPAVRHAGRGLGTWIGFWSRSSPRATRAERETAG